MSLTTDEVKKIAYLARLGIDEQHVESYARELSGLLDLVAQMDAVDVEKIVPMAHPMDQAQRLRNDLVKEEDQHEWFQSQAPQVESGLYLVPKVIE